MSLAPGRRNDVAMLEARLHNPKSSVEWSKARQKLDFIIAEGKDPKMHSYRQRLLNAARAGDNIAGERISLEIYEYQRRHGVYKHLANSNEKE
jgi:hypothetical protein